MTGNCGGSSGVSLVPLGIAPIGGELASRKRFACLVPLSLSVLGHGQDEARRVQTGHFVFPLKYEVDSFLQTQRFLQQKVATAISRY